MIRLINRRLIIPRGDTGSFTVPLLTEASSADVSIFTIFDCLTHKKVFNKVITAADNILTVEFTHEDTVNLVPGKYVWDIKFYKNPVFAEGELISGEEVHSYYAGFALPVCEIKETGDTLLTADDAPTSTMSPQQLNIITSAISETNAAKVNAAASASAAAGSAASAASDASSVSTMKSEVEASAAQVALDTAATTSAKNTAVSSAESASSSATAADASASSASASAATATTKANEASASATAAENAKVQAAAALSDIQSLHNSLAQVATSGDYEDLINKPTIPEVPINVSAFTNDVGYLTQHQDISGKANSADLATVATSGSYNDLSNKPTNVSAFTNDSGYLTSFTETDPTVPSWAKAAQKPTYTAAEVGATTTSDVNSLIASAIGNVHQFNLSIVQALPTENIDTHTIYLVPKTGDTNDVYDEYVYINNAWEMIGNTQIDLSNYVQKTDYATYSTAGIVKANMNYGTMVGNDGTISIAPATNTNIKEGTSATYRPIVASTQHQSTFYGLAKAAGDTTQAQSNNAIGTYTDNAKAAIQTMLDVPNKAALDTKAPVIYKTVTGSSLTITDAIPNLPLKSLILTIIGDPTDVGTTSASIVVSPSTIAAEGTAYTKSFDAIYEGTLDFISGKLTITKAILDLGSIGYNYNNDYHYFFSQALYGIIDTDEPIYSSDLTVVTPEEIQAGTEGVAFGGATYIYVYNNNYVGMTIDEFKAAVAGKCIAYSLRTPRVVQLSTEDIRALSGTTYIQSEDGNLSVEYLVDTKSYVDAGVGSIDLSGYATKVSSATNGNFAGLDANGNLVDSGHKHSDYLTQHQIIPVTDVQINGTSVLSSGVANIPIATANDVGVVYLATDGGLQVVEQRLAIKPATDTQIKEGTKSLSPATISKQHKSVFYGLAKAAGDSTQSASNNAVGTYTDSAKAAIQHMLGTDTIIAPYESDTTADQSYAVSQNFMMNGKLYTVTQTIAQGETITPGTNCDQTSIEAQRIKDIQINGSSVVSNGVANIPIAGDNTLGLVQAYGGDGIACSNGAIYINRADSAQIKDGSNKLRPIVPYSQDSSVFYGLAKVAGADMKNSDNAVGTYTQAAKTAIQTMLGITQTITVTVNTQDNVTVTNQTVTVREDDKNGPIFATATYSGQPVSFAVPNGFHYYISVSDTLAHHFNPTTASGIIANADVSVILTYSDFSSISSASDIKAALNAGLDLTDLVGEQITCTRDNATLTWDVVDYDVTNKTIMLLLHDAFGSANMVFEPAQALMWCENGLAAGNYKFTVDTTVYYFTLTQAIPAGGQLVASDAGTFSTYASQSATATTEIGTVSTTEISGATDLGTAASGLLNHNSRVRYGSNNYAESALLWWLNSDAAANTQRVPVTKFSRAYAYNVPGFLYNLDPDFIACLDDVEWKCSTNNVYECPQSLGGYTAGTGRAYTITKKVGLASEMEIFGSYSGNTDGSTVFDLYNGASADDRKKYRNTTAQTWWLRSPYWYHASYERLVGSSGTASTSYANSSCSVVPAVRISADEEEET